MIFISKTAYNSAIARNLQYSPLADSHSTGMRGGVWLHMHVLCNLKLQYTFKLHFKNNENTNSDCQPVADTSSHTKLKKDITNETSCASMFLQMEIHVCIAIVGCVSVLRIKCIKEWNQFIIRKGCESLELVTTLYCIVLC